MARLKPVERVLSKPYFDEEGAACARYLAERYVAPLSACVRLFTPPGGVPRLVRNAHGGWRLEEPAVGEVDDRWATLLPAAADYVPRKNAVKQAAAIEALRRGDLRVAELALELGASVGGTLKALEERGVVRIEHRRRMRGFEGRAAASPAVVGLPAGPVGADTEPRDAEASPAVAGEPPRSGAAGEPAGPSVAASPGAAPPAAAAAPGSAARPVLTPGQDAALAAIAAARAAGGGRVVLVDGVTGSGKTEVYLRAIEDVLAAGRNAIVLVPEISLTPQTVARFRGRFGDAVAVMHSRMGQGERYDQWDFIRSGAARVVVGARSALFTPLADVGLIVIDEEHEGSYKQDSAPRYQARDVAEWMMRRAGGVLVLGSATPSVEALHAAATDPAWTQVALPERANGRPLPQVEVIDMAAEFKGGSRAMFSGRLTRALADELAQGRKAVLLLNQRGFAKFLLCRDCGFVPECPSCSTSLSYHETDRTLRCHHCDYRVPAPPVCPECGSPYLKKFGAGTQRVEAELRALLDGMPGVGPAVPVIRMDADTTRGKGAHQRLLEEFAAAGSAVLLGTQMIAKGLDFDDVTLVGVINADTQLHLPDYRAAERTFDLIEQVAGRAGRAELPGRVLVQTYEADAVAIRAAARYDRALFLRAELPKRRALGYPPYVRMANVLVWGADEEAVARAAGQLHDQLEVLVRDYGGEGWCVLPATPCVLGKLRGAFRWHVVVKAPPGADVSGVLTRLFRARKADPQVSVAVDVDPVDLL
ncbi:replication restart helicase PriA [Adlercreutzia faecimuris]|uniref:Replication restart protein PriA n=1 Tax=Adlercreutzia faecimuris TaxID=2897341 RepID=A0ABS9WH15_9ACTN|nr:primosomal protein N' [Adlercreutzia sp. JBNU-10]MCI2242060.1 primosomal protein N' [Adlercreutzia sp. JBNU-10]